MCVKASSVARTNHPKAYGSYYRDFEISGHTSEISGNTFEINGHISGYALEIHGHMRCHYPNWWSL